MRVTFRGVRGSVPWAVPEGIVHVNPSGNLSGSQKSFKASMSARGELDVPFDVPAGKGTSFVILTFLWRDAARPLSISLKNPAGNSVEIPFGAPSFEVALDGFAVTGSFEASDRETMKLDLYLYPGEVVLPLPAGGWIHA